MMAEILLTWL